MISFANLLTDEFIFLKADVLSKPNKIDNLQLNKGWDDILTQIKT